MKMVRTYSKRKACGICPVVSMLVLAVVSLPAPAAMAEITDASVVLFYSRKCKGRGCNIPDEGGVWISNYKTNTVKCIWGGKGDLTDGAYFRPDGKEVAIIDNGTLYIVNSDGTNERSYQLPHWLEDRDGWGYTSMGIVYNREGDNVYCFDPATGKTHTLVTGSFSTGGLAVSADGLRGFEHGALAEGVKGGKTYELATGSSDAV